MRVVGVDIGGTFTDFMLYDTESGAVHVHKVHSTPDDPGRAMVSGLVELCRHGRIEPTEVDAVFHGTTVATNAVLEHHGAEAGMLTTRGFRDVVHIGRHQRPQHYSIMQDILAGAAARPARATARSSASGSRRRRARSSSR